MFSRRAESRCSDTEHDLHSSPLWDTQPVLNTSPRLHLRRDLGCTPRKTAHWAPKSKRTRRTCCNINIKPNLKQKLLNLKEFRVASMVWGVVPDNYAGTSGKSAADCAEEQWVGLKGEQWVGLEGERWVGLRGWRNVVDVDSLRDAACSLQSVGERRCRAQRPPAPHSCSVNKPSVWPAFIRWALTYVLLSFYSFSLSSFIIPYKLWDLGYSFPTFHFIYTYIYTYTYTLWEIMF